MHSPGGDPVLKVGGGRDGIPPPFRNSKAIPVPLNKLKTILEFLKIPLPGKK
jgi:hypothetical protein